MKEKRICPKCGKEYSEFPALSREDNKTEICPRCGVVEAFIAYGMSDEEAENACKSVEEIKAKTSKMRYENLKDDGGIV